MVITPLKHSRIHLNTTDPEVPITLHVEESTDTLPPGSGGPERDARARRDAPRGPAGHRGRALHEHDRDQREHLRGEPEHLRVGVGGEKYAGEHNGQ